LTLRGPVGRPWLEARARANRRRMPRMVHCIKLQREAEGLDKPPFKGELGKRVFDTVSKEAWRQWLEHSKMIVNEYRLDLVSPEGQRVWMDQLEKYFYGEGSAKPAEYVPPKENK
jgi:Fe-S cluster biosynthesis and repair protein YggX